jgi:hypothetical protein
VDYRWRDPARLTPERLAELKAADERAAEYERRWASYNSGQRRGQHLHEAGEDQ